MKKARTLGILLLATASVVHANDSASGDCTIDQSNVTTGGAHNVDVHEPIGQEFTPTLPTLGAVDVIFRGSTTPGSDTITVNIREGNIQSPILATTSRVVDQCPHVCTT